MGIPSAGGPKCPGQAPAAVPVPCSSALMSLQEEHEQTHAPYCLDPVCFLILRSNSLSHAFLSFPSPNPRSTPICFLLGVHFQSAGWWNLEFRPPQVMRVLGLLKVPSHGPCHLPLLPSLCPTHPCAILRWSPHLFSIPCSFELLWENGHSH